jgi:WD40 repeat protein
LGVDGLDGPYSSPQAGVDFFPPYSTISAYTSLNQDATLSGGGLTAMNAFWFRPTGLQLFTIQQATDSLSEWSLSIAWDLSTATFVQTVALDSLLVASSMQFSPDGANLYVVDEAVGIQAYTLSTPWDITTLSAVIRFNVTNQSDGLQAITIASDGSRLLTGNADSTSWFEYDLGTPFDLTTAVNGSVQAQAESPTIYATRFHGDGTKVYMLERGTGQIHEYDITGFDITTRVLADTGIDMETPAGYVNASEFQFNPDGSEVFIMDDGANLNLASYVVP